eukprot:3561753-Pleurochrysis_carterae.AAC.1
MENIEDVLGLQEQKVPWRGSSIIAGVMTGLALMTERELAANPLAKSRLQQASELMWGDGPRQKPCHKARPRSTWGGTAMHRPHVKAGLSFVREDAVACIEESQYLRVFSSAGDSNVFSKDATTGEIAMASMVADYSIR